MPFLRLAAAFACLFGSALALSEEERVEVRDVKIDGRSCQQNATYHASGKRSSLIVTCNGKREGSYGRYDERGKPLIEGGFLADAPFGTWTFRDGEGRLQYKMIFMDGHASQRVPPLAVGEGAGIELYAHVKSHALRLEVDGKLTTIGKKHVETYLDEKLWQETQQKLEKAWLALEKEKPASPSASETERRELALRKGKMVHRIVCGKTCPLALEPVRAFAEAQLAAAAKGEDRLAILGIEPSDSPGSLDFPPAKP